MIALRKLVIGLATAVLIAVAPVMSAAGEGAADAKSAPGIRLSPELLALLRSEMIELAGGVRTIPLALVSADWETIEETSKRMHQSYIMKKSLTPPQAAELGQRLPPAFKHLDAAFHARAKQLGDAASARDPELVAFHYSRLIEACADCHARFASGRFPGFEAGGKEGHHH